VRRFTDRVANDRIFLRCPKCLDVNRLYSYYPSGYAGGTVEEYPDDTRYYAMQIWMDEHIHGCGEIFGGDLGGHPFFTLVTENPEVMEHLFRIQIPREEKEYGKAEAGKRGEVCGVEE
jgi:hypothetical protein